MESAMPSAIANPYVNLLLKIPAQYSEDFKKYTSTFKAEDGANKDIDRSPFDRYVDFWWAAIGVGVSEGRMSSTEDAEKFVTGVVLSQDPWRITHLELLAIAHTGSPDVIGKPGEVIEIANGYAATGVDVGAGGDLSQESNDGADGESTPIRVPTTAKTAAHFGHLTFLPTNLSATLSFALQLSHFIIMGTPTRGAGRHRSLQARAHSADSTFSFFMSACNSMRLAMGMITSAGVSEHMKGSQPSPNAQQGLLTSLGFVVSTMTTSPNRSSGCRCHTSTDRRLIVPGTLARSHRSKIRDEFLLNLFCFQ